MSHAHYPCPDPIRPINPGRPVIVGLSGGVDSSVAAWLLAREYQVQALFMKNWEEDDRDGHCSAAEDLADASAVARQLGLPLLTRNFASEYWQRVFSHCLEEFRRGRTPNPDVWCNREIKFQVFLDQALDLGADGIATGHYARIGRDGDLLTLEKGRDPDKDQSYFLHTLGQHQLAHSLFPLGDLLKDQVRALAREQGLVTHQKKDSTGICFIGERNFRQFLKQYLPAQPGEIHSPEGRVLGEHQGLMYHTLGQRKGLGIGGLDGAGEQPWYVVAKDLSRNVLVVAQGHDHPLLMSSRLRARELSWVTGTAPTPGTPLQCKTRYRQPDQACHISDAGSDADGPWLTVSFDRPQRAVTPGQSVVFYQGDVCLGGGVIDSCE